MDEIIEILNTLCDDVDITSINEGTCFMEDLEISSLDFFSLISELEADHGITISEREIQNIVSVGDLIHLLNEKTQ